MGSDAKQQPSGWELVNLGIKAPRAYICVCCLATSGLGMHRWGLTYCTDCWEKRQEGESCLHHDAPGLRRDQAG